MRRSARTTSQGRLALASLLRSSGRLSSWLSRRGIPRELDGAGVSVSRLEFWLRLAAIYVVGAILGLVVVWGWWIGAATDCYGIEVTLRVDGDSVECIG